MMTLDEGGWRRSAVRVVAPPPALRDLVELFWIDEWSGDEGHGRQFRIVADDAPHVLWYLDGADGLRTQRVSLVGARAHYHDADLTGRRLLIGARLLPGTLPIITGYPAFALTNRMVPLAAVASCPSRTLERIRPRSPDECVHELSSVLEQLRGRCRRLDPRAEWTAMLSRTESPSVGVMAKAFGMSTRAIRSWSTATLGMGVKRLLTIRRLHAALELRMSGARDTWSQVAAAAGYADQSHLIRDCRALLGESPARFVARAG